MKITLDVRPFREHLYKLKRLQKEIDAEVETQLNRVTDRHFGRVKKNTDPGDSPDSPTLRGRWERSGVHFMSDGVYAEVFNPVEYAAYYEYGHRQTPGRIVFIELKPGQQKYGQAAKEIKRGKYAGKWGIYVRLKKPFVKGRFVMTDSEKRAQPELDAACRRIEAFIRKGLG
jgi:hypothetical protein